MNQVTFHWHSVRGRVEYVSARVVLPSGREIGVSYHPSAIVSGRVTRERDTLFLDGCEFTDRHEHDLFCSEMFGELTGRFPFEITENTAPNEDYAPFSGR